MYTDMVGYTALGQRNESLSLALVEEQRKLIRPILARHNGREVKTMGDAFLVEFPNATDSVRCAYDIQRATKEFNLALVSDKRIHLKIGIHLGEVVESEGDISGDAVNVASRIYPLADDGGVCLTRHVYDQVLNKTELNMTSIGVKPLKNVSAPIEVYKVIMPWEQTAAVEAPTFAANRIAILPFRNMSPDPNDEYFAEGMTEEIISTVSGISGLDVISRTSVMGYKGTTKRVEEIGKELKVGSVLEGSLRKAGNRIRVTTQLIEVAADKHLWAQSYDRELDDVFEVQCDVAKQVAEALKVKVLFHEMERIERKPTESTAAYTLYLKGRFAWSKRGIRYNEEARECFEQAIKEDPGFALGYIGQADCCLVLRNNWGIDREANLERAKSLVADALELDAELAEAHATNGLIQWEEYKLGPAEEEFRKAIEMKPSYATAHQWYFALLVSQLRWGEALEQIERAVELDPFSPIINLNHGYFYFFKRDYGKALELYKRVAALDPDLKALDLSFAGAPSGMADAYGKLKMFEDMKREFANFASLLRGTYPLIKIRVDARIAYFEGEHERLRRILPELETHLNETGSNAYSVACFYFSIGEKDKGFEWLERSYSRKEDTLLYIKWDWDLDGVRNDPRYLDLLKRLGLD
jgi:TolB-like protein